MAQPHPLVGGIISGSGGVLPNLPCIVQLCFQILVCVLNEDSLMCFHGFCMFVAFLCQMRGSFRILKGLIPHIILVSVVIGFELHLQ